MKVRVFLLCLLSWVLTSLYSQSIYTPNEKSVSVGDAKEVKQKHYDEFISDLVLVFGEGNYNGNVIEWPTVGQKTYNCHFFALIFIGWIEIR